MALSYEEINQYFDKEEAELEEIRLKFDKYITTARDKGGAPLYLTKTRIKTRMSAYLKTKRKDKSKIEDLGDMIGVRVLCLYEQNIYAVFDFLARMLMGFPVPKGGCMGGEFELHEILFYNWRNTDMDVQFLSGLKRILEDEKVTRCSVPELTEDRNKKNSREGTLQFILNENPKRAKIRTEQRPDGYKCIHFTCSAGKHKVEVQLRTLLQDVWAELDHSLAYKKGWNDPHVDATFRSLATELQAKDLLIDHLKQHRDRESVVGRYLERKAGPTRWYAYKAGDLDKVFTDPTIAEAVKSYNDYMHRYSRSRRLKGDWTPSEARKHFDAIKNSAVPTKFGAAWLGLEEGFLCLTEGNLAGAREAYKRVQSPELGWILHLRLGEVCLIEGEIELALVQFDICEQHLAEASIVHLEVAQEQMSVKDRLAYIYWTLGPEYADVAVNKIKEAKKVFKEHNEQKLTPKQIRSLRRNLQNNLVYYSMEKCLTANDQLTENAWIAKLSKKLEELAIEDSKLGDTVSANLYDTLAWCAYEQYAHLMTIYEEGGLKKATKNEALEALKRAQHFMDLSAECPVRGVRSQVLSSHILREHMKKITFALESQKPDLEKVTL